MWFGSLSVEESLGCILAHSVKAGKRRIKKGVVIDDPLLVELLEAGIRHITVARLDAGDVHEDAAALQVATALCGAGVVADTANTGRVNVFAEHDGLLRFDARVIEALNGVDESITVATLPEDTWVLAGRMVATSKIISYGVDRERLSESLATIESRLSVEPVTAHTATLIQTELPSLKSSVLDKTRGVTENRLSVRNASLLTEHRCQHDTDALTELLMSINDGDWILIAGASAISDRFDVIPQAIIASGGSVTRYGIPVDPGNLLLLGELHGRAVIGLPGCARSPRLNGLDLLLNRMACNVEITSSWLNSLAVGGLLTEMVDRPQPRVHKTTRASATVAGLVLAAGASRRAGDVNKLLYQVAGVPLVRTVVEKSSASKLQKVFVVTGHQHKEVEDALRDAGCETGYCANHEQGMAHSLSYGISQLQAHDAVLVLLGDMPDLSVALINTMLNCEDEDIRENIHVPVYKGKRGNPVMVGRAFFDTLLEHTGDTGARFLMRQYPERVVEVEVDDGSVLVDYDTQEALATLTMPDKS